MLKREMLIGSISLAIVLLLTLNVTGIMALGATWELQQGGTGVAEGSTEQAHDSFRSIKLTTVTTSDWARVVFLGQGEKLSDITALSYWSYVASAPVDSRVRPWIGIYLDSDGDLSTWEYYLQAEPMYAYPAGAFPGSLNTWEYWNTFDSEHPLRWLAYEAGTGFSSPDLPYEAPTLQDYITGAAVNYLTEAHGYQQFATREYGSLTIQKIVFMAGYGSTWAGFIGYVDDITINTITTTFEKPVGGVIVPVDTLSLIVPYLLIVAVIASGALLIIRKSQL